MVNYAYFPHTCKYELLVYYKLVKMQNAKLQYECAVLRYCNTSYANIVRINHAASCCAHRTCQSLWAFPNLGCSHILSCGCISTSYLYVQWPPVVHYWFANLLSLVSIPAEACVCVWGGGVESGNLLKSNQGSIAFHYHPPIILI